MSPRIVREGVLCTIIYKYLGMQLIKIRYVMGVAFTIENGYIMVGQSKKKKKKDNRNHAL